MIHCHPGDAYELALSLASQVLVVGRCTTIKVFVCFLCVFFPFILDMKFVGRTNRGRTGGRSRRISHPPSFCRACLNFSREKDSAIPFPRRPWSRIMCTNDLIVLHPLGKNPVYRDRPHVPTCQKVTRLPLSYRGDKLLYNPTNSNANISIIRYCAVRKHQHFIVYETALRCNPSEPPH